MGEAKAYIVGEEHLEDRVSKKTYRIFIFFLEPGGQLEKYLITFCFLDNPNSGKMPNGCSGVYGGVHHLNQRKTVQRGRAVQAVYSVGNTGGATRRL